MYNQPHIPTRRIVRSSTGVQTRDNRHRALAMSLYMILSAIFALWIAYLPTLISIALEALNVIPAHLAFLSGDRSEVELSGVPFNARWSAVADNKLLNLGDDEAAENQRSVKTSTQVQVGCETLGVGAALSKAHCLTAVNLRAHIGDQLDHQQVALIECQ